MASQPSDSIASHGSPGSGSGESPVDAANRYLYEYRPGMTIFDRFQHIKAPGGVRMMKTCKDSYTVAGMRNACVPWFDKELLRSEAKRCCTVVAALVPSVHQLLGRPRRDGRGVGRVKGGKEEEVVAGLWAVGSTSMSFLLQRWA
eukprot:255700-Pyramimonas_sp.AAC.1